jgi:hypothetical protein
MLFSDFFDLLSKEIGQDPEAGDNDSEYQFVNPTYAIHYTNETIKELVDRKPILFREEYLHVFNGETTVFELPSGFHSLEAYYDATNEVWKKCLDSSDMTASLRAITPTKIVLKTPMQKGESILLRVAKYPPDIVSESDAVPFPEPHLHYLRLEIAVKVLGGKGKSWSELTERKYQTSKLAFDNACKKIDSATRLHMRGYSFGRK